MTAAELTHLQRFQALLDRQIEQDERWLREDGWSRRTIGRVTEARRARIAAGEALSFRAAVTRFLLALHEPRAERIGR